MLSSLADAAAAAAAGLGSEIIIASLS